VRRFVTAGEQARFVPELPMKLILIDERTVMFAMPDPVAGTDSLTAVIIDHPALAKVLETAFETVWETGVGIERAHQRVGVSYPRDKCPRTSAACWWVERSALWPDPTTVGWRIRRRGLSMSVRSGCRVFSIAVTRRGLDRKSAGCLRCTTISGSTTASGICLNFH
jgi:hypothetical protein